MNKHTKRHKARIRRNKRKRIKRLAAVRGCDLESAARIDRAYMRLHHRAAERRAR